MLYRDQRITEATVKDRLKQLTWARLAVYSVGCVTHAQQRIASNIAGKPQIHFATVCGLLARFWHEYPASLRSPIIEALVEEGDQLLPEEGDASEIAWEHPLIWGMVYAFSVVNRPSLISDVFNAAASSAEGAYWSVLAFWHGDVFHSDCSTIHSIELSSQVCTSEIEFQLKFLNLLEGCTDPPPAYANLLLEMK